MTAWHDDRCNPAALARYMGERGDSVDDVAYMLEKPEEYEDDWRLMGRVHNHRPYRPVCNERLVGRGAQLRGACLNDDGTDR